MAIFTSYASIFLPRYSGVRPTIRPAINTESNNKDQDAVHARAHAAKNHFAQHDVDQRDHAAERSKRIVHAVDRSAACVGSHGGEESGVGDAEADFLAFHVAAGLQCERLADRFRPAEDCRATPPSKPSLRRQRTAPPWRAKTAQPCFCDPVIRPSVYVRPAGMAKIETISKKLLNGVGFSNGCALLAFKKAAAIGSQLFDGFL